jgi:DNA invertase Pin-like site-specific DNA recombinase
MLIGYLRVSTKEQDASLDAQMQKLTEFGCEKFYTDKAQSGEKRDRPELGKALSLSAVATLWSSPSLTGCHGG